MRTPKQKTSAQKRYEQLKSRGLCVACGKVPAHPGKTKCIQGGINAGLDTCWFNPNHAENPGKVIPTYEITRLEELYPLVMEQEELANVGQKNRRHQC